MTWCDKKHRLGREVRLWKVLHSVYLIGVNILLGEDIYDPALMSIGSKSSFWCLLFINIHDPLKTVLSISGSVHAWRSMQYCMVQIAVCWDSNKDCNGVLLVIIWFWRSHLTSLSLSLLIYRVNQSEYHPSMSLSKGNIKCQTLPLGKK